MSAGTRRRSQGVGRIFAVPALLAVLTIAGLVLGLAGDGLNDVISWLFLLPLPLVMAWAWARRQ